MSKYTELFSEYLDNNSLPAIFNQIVGFEDLFKGYYADKEIGFETEILFQLKLETYANLFIPQYKQKIDLLDTFITNLQNPDKVKRIVHDLGEIENLSWVLPFNSNTSEPSTKSKALPSQSVDTESDTGFTSDEILRIIENLRVETQNLKYKLLLEFKKLFMEIY